MDALIVAAVVRLAQQADDSDLQEYLSHGSHFSADFTAAVEKHLNNLKELDSFTARHHTETHPSETGRTDTYTKAEVDRMIKDAIANARRAG